MVYWTSSNYMKHLPLSCALQYVSLLLFCSTFSPGNLICPATNTALHRLVIFQLIQWKSKSPWPPRYLCGNYCSCLPCIHQRAWKYCLEQPSTWHDINLLPLVNWIGSKINKKGSSPFLHNRNIDKGRKLKKAFDAFLHRKAKKANTKEESK